MICSIPLKSNSSPISPWESLDPNYCFLLLHLSEHTWPSKCVSAARHASFLFPAWWAAPQGPWPFVPSFNITWWAWILGYPARVRQAAGAWQLFIDWKRPIMTAFNPRQAFCPSISGARSPHPTSLSGEDIMLSSGTSTRTIISHIVGYTINFLTVRDS